MSDSWAVCEFSGDVDAFGSARVDRWLAVTPVAMDDIAEKGFDLLVDGAICPPEEMNRIGEENFDRAERLVAACDSMVFDRCPVIRRFGIAPFRAHFTRVKFLLDAITTRLHILKAAVECGGRRFYKTHCQDPEAAADPDLFYPFEASLYGELLELLSREGRLVLTRLPCSSERSRRASRLPPSRAVIRHIASTGRDFLESLFVFRDHLSESKRILLLSTGYDLKWIAEECHARGIEVFWLDLRRLRLYRFPGRRLCRVRLTGRDAPSWWIGSSGFDWAGAAADDLCRYENISYVSIVQRILGRYLRDTFPRAHAIRSFLEECQRKFCFDMVFSPTGPERLETNVLFDFCRRACLPVAVFQHGSYGVTDNPVTNYSDFGFDGDFLAWGTGVGAHYDVSKKGSVRFVPVGAPTLDAIVSRRAQTAKNPRSVMYIVTDLRGYTAYFPGGQAWLDTVYYRLLNEVLDLLERHAAVYEIKLKLPPDVDQNPLARNPVEERLRRRGSRIAVEKRPLLEVIDEPVLFIIDLPTTALLQCLATRAEVIVRTGTPHCPVLPEAKALLEKRATCCQTHGDFLEAVSLKLSQGPNVTRTELNDAFLSRYGTFVHDGGSSRRLRIYLEEKGVLSLPLPEQSACAVKL